MSSDARAAPEPTPVWLPCRWFCGIRADGRAASAPTLVCFQPTFPRPPSRKSVRPRPAAVRHPFRRPCGLRADDGATFALCVSGPTFCVAVVLTIRAAPAFTHPRFLAGATGPSMAYSS
eukprot:CAMPEP_0184189398 /NCGR_PEP_ID=MMETSP0976-20121227/1935_1 /TAXON_ID=483370 /ORGANISM="non described non described, Strain CCMP2097" /LENGTH=118 /DNA_ID=CAMNT_0026493753 /DNA_START=290 /DNA_END=647 /DNA_ORIENTATION=+